MTDLKAMAEYGAKLTTLPARFIAAWWDAENGHGWPASNNPGNISWEYAGMPPQVEPFKGTVHVDANRVCVFDTPEHGVEAWAALLKAPTHAHGGTKDLTVDLADLQACGGDIKRMCEAVGKSNWASGHYIDGQDAQYDFEGGSIYGAYQSTFISGLFDTPQTPPAPVVEAKPTVPTSGHAIHYVAHGDTLYTIALRYRVPMEIIRLVNDITHGPLVEGEKIVIPHHYQVRAGDTLAGLSRRFGESIQYMARVNRLEDPNLIRAGQTIWY